MCGCMPTTRIVAICIFILPSNPINPKSAQVGSALLQLHGPIPRALLLQILLHVTGQSYSKSSLGDSNTAGQAQDSRDTVTSAYDAKQLTSQPLQRQVARLLNSTTEAMQSPVDKSSKLVSAASSVTYARGKVSTSMIRLWDLNCPPAADLVRDGFALQLQAAATLLLELTPTCVSCMEKQVSFPRCDLAKLRLS